MRKYDVIQVYFTYRTRIYDMYRSNLSSAIHMGISTLPCCGRSWALKVGPGGTAVSLTACNIPCFRVAAAVLGSYFRFGCQMYTYVRIHITYSIHIMHHIPSSVLRVVDIITM